MKTLSEMKIILIFIAIGILVVGLVGFLFLNSNYNFTMEVTKIPPTYLKGIVIP